MFIDKVLVLLKAGDGGNGASSFRKEKYVDRGGPDGGDGGRGGNVVFVADGNTNTLAGFRYKQELKAEDGTAGSKRQKHGKNGDDLEVHVPVGTLVYEEDRLVADLTFIGQKQIIAKGGDGGFGNSHFKSSVRQAPKVAEIGERGEGFTSTLELKLLADIGLIGFPNAGKSTFLSVVTNAKPEIADYAFTTLSPNLGVADQDGQSLLIADIPGLIEGASAGKGLGDQFLRHVERTAVLFHLIDIYEEDVAAAYATINGELRAYSSKLAKLPQLVVLTKIEGFDEETIAAKLAEIKSIAGSSEVFAISSLSRVGLEQLLRAARKYVDKAREVAVEEAADGRVIIGLNEEQKQDAWKILKEGEKFILTGHKIEKFAARTNFASEPGRRRLWDIMHKMGIMHELERKNVKAGDTIIIGRAGDFKLKMGER